MKRIALAVPLTIGLTLAMAGAVKAQTRSACTDRQAQASVASAATPPLDLASGVEYAVKTAESSSAALKAGDMEGTGALREPKVLTSRATGRSSVVSDNSATTPSGIPRSSRTRTANSSAALQDSVVIPHGSAARANCTTARTTIHSPCAARKPSSCARLKAHGASSISTGPRGHPARNPQ